MSGESFSCFVVERIDGKLRQSITTRTLAELPPGEVTIRVEYSSLNYKDALAATAHPGVVRKLPHVPGIDAAGEVLASSDSRFKPGDRVIATSYEIGAERWGGWSERLRVPADWVVPLPTSLSTRDAMVLGTAGLTAAIGVATLVEHGVLPEGKEIVVTGATGGVGCLAVMLLAMLEYRVVAVTGKSDQVVGLRELGAGRVISRDELIAPADKPLLSVKYGGGIDTVGGLMLSTLLRSTDRFGCVAACGLVGGDDLPITVHPFILRGITLSGISTVNTPMARRFELWRRLAGTWRYDVPPRLVQQVKLSDLPSLVAKMLDGKSMGRTIIDLTP